MVYLALPQDVANTPDLLYQCMSASKYKNSIMEKIYAYFSQLLITNNYKRFLPPKNSPNLINDNKFETILGFVLQERYIVLANQLKRY